MASTSDLLEELAQASVDVIKTSARDAQVMVFVYRDGLLAMAHNVDDAKVPQALRHFADMIEKENP